MLIGDDYTARLLWPLDRVMETIPGKDGIMRVVRLVTASGQLIRRIQRLYPLEVNHDFAPEPRLRNLYKRKIIKSYSSREKKTSHSERLSQPSETEHIRHGVDVL